MAGDTNAHTPLLGGNNTNPRGEELEEFVFQHDLFVHNQGDVPTWLLRRGDGIVSSFIDTTITFGIFQYFSVYFTL